MEGTRRLWRRMLPPRIAIAELEREIALMEVPLPPECVVPLDLPPTDHPEVLCVPPPEERRKQSEHVRSYQRELTDRLRALSIDADVLGRHTPRVQGAGRE